MWKDVKRAAKLFRLPQNVAPHSARKVYAVELMEKYGDIAVVRKALNHSSDSVTLIYALADSSCKPNIPAAVGKKAAQRFNWRLTSRAGGCIVKKAVPGGEVTIAERHNKLHFVAVAGGAQTPIYSTPANATK